MLHGGSNALDPEQGAVPCQSSSPDTAPWAMLLCQFCIPLLLPSPHQPSELWADLGPQGLAVTGHVVCQRDRMTSVFHLTPPTPLRAIALMSTLERREGPFLWIAAPWTVGHWLGWNIVDLKRILWLPLLARHLLSVWQWAILLTLHQILVVEQGQLFTFYRWKHQGSERGKYVCKFSVSFQILWERSYNI